MAEGEEKRITVKVAYNYFQAGNWDRALEEYKKLIAIDPMDFLVHNMLAEIYNRKGDKVAAIHEYLNAAGLLRATNSMEKAIQAYTRILKLDPTYQDARDKIEEVIKTRMVEVHDLIRRGMLKQALELCGRLDEKLPNHPAVAEQIAEIGKLQQAQAAACVAQAEAASDPSVKEAALAAIEAAAGRGGDVGLKREEVVKNLYAMAEMYENKQAWDEAVEAYITILRFNPDDDSARMKLHALYRKVTRQDKAVEVWERIKSEDKRRIDHAKRLAKDPEPSATDSAIPPESTPQAGNEALAEPMFTVPKRAEFNDLAEMERLRLEAESRLRRAVEDRRERDKTQREQQAPGPLVSEPGMPIAADADDVELGVLITQAQMYIQQNLLIEAMRLCQRILEDEPQNQDVRGLLQKIFERKKF
jgi:tetratricopeptide (TPR) repeat protein